MMIKGGIIQKSDKKSLKAKGNGKANGKGKDKQVYIPKPKNSKTSAKEHPAKDDTCHHCKEVGHCKRNCPAYLAELIKKKKKVGTASSSDVFIIELFSFPTKSWVYDTSCGTHICNTKHGLGGVRKLKQVEAIGSFDLVLPNGLVICLDNCHYGPSITRGVVSVYRLVENGFVQLIPKETMGYYFYFPPENKIVVARYAEFFEKRLISQEISGRAVDLEEIQEEEDTTPSEITSNIPQEVEGFEPPQPPQEEVILIRRSERTRRAPNRLCLNVEVEEHSLGDLNEPTSYKAENVVSESNKWIDDRNFLGGEIQSMMDNMVWVLVDLPPGCKTVGSKWLFKKKTDIDGIVYVYKARLVANGYTQLYEVDYKETFSLVADIRAIRILISIIAYYDYEIWQIDVKTTFLNGYLDEDIYMVQPEGFVDPNHPRKVCKLQRSIYGLKQTSRSWNKRFDEEIKSLQSVKNYLGKCFSMKDLGEAAFILGIKIYRDRSKRLIGIGQNAYMDKILKRYKMDNSKRGHIPMQERLDLNKSQGAQTPKEVNRMKNVPYASAVGSIMNAVRCTRPNVAFAQNLTSRFQQNPGELHWTAVKNILKYLRNTKDMFLVYGGNPSTELRVECYCNAGFETDIDDMKSLTGYVSF
ncbi:retrotransposon protein, putative, ty1-copia subclass [Tanacetum coccineum]